MYKRQSLHHLENDYLKVTLDPHGQFSSIYDKKARRELLKAGKNGNVLMTYEDRPHNYDAWDVNNYYVEKSWEITDCLLYTSLYTIFVNTPISLS